MSAYSDFISDSNRQGVHLYEISYIDMETGTPGKLYYSTSKWGTRPADTLVSKRYDARILEGYRHVSSSGAAGEGGIAPRVGLLPAREGGSFSVAQKFGDLDVLRNYNFDKQPVVIRYGGESKYGVLAYADFKIVHSGVCDGQPLIGLDEVTFKLAARDSLLYSPIQTKRYRGGNWCLYADDGGTAEITLTNNAAYNFQVGDPFTVEFWYLPLRAGDPGDSTTAQVILCRGLSANYGWQIFQSKDDEMGFTSARVAFNSDYTYTDTIEIGVWQHVAVCYDGVDTATICINGVDRTVTAGVHDSIASTTVPLYLFRAQGSGSDYRANCMIDEIRIWNRVRTQVEIAGAMDRQLGADEITDTDLIGYWSCDEGTGTTIEDQSVTGQDGTLTDVEWLPSLQGGDELVGALVPDTWGEKNGMKPLRVHAQTNIYQVHSTLIEDVVDVFEGLNPRDMDGAEITDLVTFLQDTTEVGMYQVLNCEQGSYIRLRSRPTLPPSVTLKGDKSDGTYRDNPVELARYIVCSRGQHPLTDADDIDDAAFDAAVTATSGMIVGLTTYDDAQVADVVSHLLAGAGVAAWFKRDGGRFTALRYDGAAGGTPVLALDRTDIAEGTLEPLDAGPPICRATLSWGRNDVVHDTADIAGAIQGTEGQNFGMSDIRLATVFNQQTLEDFPSAGEISIETALTYGAHAWAEAARLQTLYGKMPQAFTAFFKHRSVELERFDCFSLQYQDFDRRGVLQSRLGTSAPGETPTQYTVLALEENEVEGGTLVTFTREDITVDAD